ncbi:MAG: hydrogenase maturation protease [Gemmatimonadota bacterium]|nr:hydrogenase maturation protease [Gemmatimonadota bacterium]
MTRTLIAGFGNVLRGDDAFGVEVIHRLEALGVDQPGIELMEVGTGGIRLAQELLTPCDCLIIADAMTQGCAPGTVYVLEVESVERVNEVDMHVAIPSHALSVAQALGVLPSRVVLVGCEPLIVDELTWDMSEPVRLAVGVAVERIQGLLAELHAQGSPQLGIPNQRVQTSCL